MRYGYWKACVRCLDVDQAIKILEKAIEQGVSDCLTYVFLAHLKQKQGNVQEALQLLETNRDLAFAMPQYYSDQRLYILYRSYLHKHRGQTVEIPKNYGSDTLVAGGDVSL